MWDYHYMGPSLSPGMPVRLSTGSLPTLVASTTCISLPTYDRSRLSGGIVHLGMGAFHRAHLAVYLHDLAQKGVGTWSVTGSGVMPHDEQIAAVLGAQDGLYCVVERDGAQSTVSVIGSILNFDPAHRQSATLLARLIDPATRIVSMTITEGGYPVDHGAFVSSHDLERDAIADVPRSTFAIVAAALDARRLAGHPPFTVLSCDNLPGNGTVSRIATLGVAALRSPALASWLETNGAFPNSMVDRITPATTNADRQWLEDTIGIVDGWPVTCEPFRQWALEDHFVDGRPAFEEAGVLMTADVLPYEHMKLRLLNASHSALAYHAALAGHTLVHNAVLDLPIEQFIRQLMANEAAPNLASPAGIDLVEYQESLVRRFSNAAIADQVARLCLDGTSKFPTFIVPSIEAQLTKGASVRMLALAVAGWCRYLQGSADDGTALTLAHDPFLAEATDFAQRAVHDPAVFLHYRRGLGSVVGQSETFEGVFTEALNSLARIGSRATLEQWTAVGD